MAQFECTYEILTTADSGTRDPRKCLWGVFHTTEDPEGKDPRATAQWQTDPANESSYNILVGGNGETVRSNDDNYSPWSVGMPGNRLGIHASAIGKAARTREAWLKRPKQLEALAQWAANLNREYQIPLVWLTPGDVAGMRRRGFTSHANYWKAIGKAQGMAVRTDPGEGFPYDVILKRAAEINEDHGAITTMDNRKQDLILDQLVGYPNANFPGWSQLGGLTLVDAVATIGAHLKIDGFKDMRGRHLGTSKETNV